MTRWRTKTVEQTIADTDEPDTRLRKSLTWWDLTVFGVSVVVGAGIFTVTASTAGNITGPASRCRSSWPPSPAGWPHCATPSSRPPCPSPAARTSPTFGEFVAWIIGWDLILEFSIGAAVVPRDGRPTWARCSASPAGWPIWASSNWIGAHC
jgi:APA family basic amino acid/polyamine antiporter